MEFVPKRYLIVGGGASGVITAIALIRDGIAPEQIVIAEPRELLGEGLAYRTRDALHRLNVLTSRMSAIADAPDDFVEWSNAIPYSFMERRNYSTYLRDRLGNQINHTSEFVLDLTPQSNGQTITTFSSGSTTTYGGVVLAMGIEFHRYRDDSLVAGSKKQCDRYFGLR